MNKTALAHVVRLADDWQNPIPETHASVTPPKAAMTPPECSRVPAPSNPTAVEPNWVILLLALVLAFGWWLCQAVLSDASGPNTKRSTTPTTATSASASVRPCEEILTGLSNTRKHRDDDYLDALHDLIERWLGNNKFHDNCSESFVNRSIRNEEISNFRKRASAANMQVLLGMHAGDNGSDSEGALVTGLDISKKSADLDRGQLRQLELLRQEYTHREIGRELGISRSTIHRNNHRIRETLREVR